MDKSPHVFRFPKWAREAQTLTSTQLNGLGRILLPREERIVRMVGQQVPQTEIASLLDISPPRVHSLLRGSISKIRWALNPETLVAHSLDDYQDIYDSSYPNWSKGRRQEGSAKAHASEIRRLERHAIRGFMPETREATALFRAMLVWEAPMPPDVQDRE